MTPEEISKCTEINTLQSEKLTLERLLRDTDYKVIKNAEAAAVNIALPYDPVTLHAEKQAWRDNINAIDARIAELTAAEEIESQEAE